MANIMGGSNSSPPETAMQKKKRRLIDMDHLIKAIMKEDYQGVDLISNLADDVLLHMLSLVGDMKTVARTSLLSKRWTHVWTRLMDLDFNDPKTVPYTKLNDSNFVNMVNRVISANRAPYLNTFRIQFPLHVSYADHIQNWLKFAFGKEVRNLVLIFGTYPKIDFFDVFSTNPALNFNTTLTTLHLQSVTIKGALAFLQWVLTNCLNLQSLSLHSCISPIDELVASSKRPRKLVVSSLTVKHLEFRHCLMLLYIEALYLSAPNLTSFILYENNIIDVEYHSFPSVVDAAWSCLPHLDTLSRFSSQLEKLTIIWNKVHSRYSGFPTFVNVQQLEIESGYYSVDLIQSTSFIEACPLLHTFKLKLIYRNQIQGCPDDAQINAMRTHQHLKTVEYAGYTGSVSAAELALCLTQHAPMLRRFIFYTDQRGYMGNPRKVSISDYEDQMAIVRKTQWLAKRIQGSNGHVDVVIL